VTAAFVIPPALILERTGAPKPIEESCRLVYFTNNQNLMKNLAKPRMQNICEKTFLQDKKKIPL